MLTNPESRRGWRTILLTVAILAMLYFAWEWTANLDNDGKREAMRYALGIVAAFTLFTGAENFRRAKWEATIGGNKFGGELDGGEADA